MLPLPMGGIPAGQDTAAGAGKLAGSLPPPTVLIGDLNVTMWANHYKRLERASGLKNARHGFGVQPTWPLFLPFAIKC